MTATASASWVARAGVKGLSLKKRVGLLVIVLLIVVLLVPSVVSGYVGLGGYVAEKLLGSGPVPDASLLLGDGSRGPVVLGYGVIISQGRDVAFSFLINILTLALALGLFIFILRLSGNPLVALVGTLIGLLAVAIVQALLNASW